MENNYPTYIGSLFCGVCRNKDAKKHYVKKDKHLLYCIDCYNKVEQQK